MASVNLQEKANFTRLNRLLVDKGTEALRNCLYNMYATADLPRVLEENRTVLHRLKVRGVIKNIQWDLLFPSSGNPPDSRTFDINLIFILLRNICELSAPVKGWYVMPPSTDTSIEANVIRIRLIKDQVSALVAASTQVDNTTFENLWREISQALIGLGIPQQEIDDLKICPLSPEEEVYYSQQRKEKEMLALSEVPWKWEKISIIHRKKLEELVKHGQEHPENVEKINGVRVCCSKEFLIAGGSDGTRVYVGLGKDGREMAVKRLPKDTCAKMAENEMKILRNVKATESNHVVTYWLLDVESDKEYIYLITDLCEETLEQFVDDRSSDELKAVAPEIIQQVLNGLSDLHREPNPILHRDLKPSNILQNIHGKWLLADFGISRILTGGKRTHRTNQGGTENWIAVESHLSDGMSVNDEVRYKKESDIQVAGMVAFYIVTKGQHVFGKTYQLPNLLDGKPVGLANLKDPVLKDLLSWMLSHDPADRPSAKEALKHPYLQPRDQQFEMLSEMGNQGEIKTEKQNSAVVQQLNADTTDWKTQMERDVLDYFCTDSLNGKSRTFKYGESWTECLRLIRNVKQHLHDHARPLPQPKALGDPREYFLNVFPSLPAKVHKIVRSCDWKERPELQKYFM